MKKSSLIFYSLLLLAMACKQENDTTPDSGIETPVISGISKPNAQPGDTITVKGAHLKQDTLTTSLAISGRPARITLLTADSLQAIVPAGTYAGKLMVTISKGNAFASAYGPSLNIIPIAVINSHSPAYLYGGETVTLVVKDFAQDNNENYLEIDGQPMRIVYNNGKDTIKAEVPANASTGVFRWRTYGGSMQTGASPLYVRKKNYTAANMKEWVAQDPGFRFMNEVFTYNVSLERTEYIYLKPYADGVNNTVVFLPEDNYYIAQGITTPEQFRTQVLNGRAYLVISSILASCVSTFTGDAGSYPTALNRSIVTASPSNPEVYNHVDITKEGDDYYIQARAYWGLMDVKLKATFLGTAGGTKLYQVSKLLPYDNEYF